MKIKAINWLYKFLVALGPMFPVNGGMIPWTAAKFKEYVEIETGNTQFETPESYQGYLEQWSAEWKQMHPDIPVPPAA